MYGKFSHISKVLTAGARDVFIEVRLTLAYAIFTKGILILAQVMFSTGTTQVLLFHCYAVPKQ